MLKKHIKYINNYIFGVKLNIIYNDIKINNCTYYINRIFPCKININFEFTLTNFKIYQVEKLLDENINNIDIIYKYDIILVNEYTYINNIYRQQINIINGNYLLLLTINKIYSNLDDNLGYDFIVDNYKYYIVSNKYISRTELFFINSFIQICSKLPLSTPHSIIHPSILFCNM